MNITTMIDTPTCPWCKKPKQPPMTLIRWENGTFQHIPMNAYGMPVSLDYPCNGHVSVECPVCRWMVVLEYHTPEDCERLRDGSR